MWTVKVALAAGAVLAMIALRPQAVSAKGIDFSEPGGGSLCTISASDPNATFRPGDIEHRPPPFFGQAVLVYLKNGQVHVSGMARQVGAEECEISVGIDTYPLNHMLASDFRQMTAVDVRGTCLKSLGVFSSCQNLSSSLFQVAAAGNLKFVSDTAFVVDVVLMNLAVKPGTVGSR